MSTRNIFILRNDAKKIFGKSSYDRSNPTSFTFTISQVKKLASWASTTGKSTGYLRSPYIPAHKNQASYKAELHRRLLDFLNGDVAKQIPANKLIDVRYLMDTKIIRAFETLLMWAAYYKIGSHPTKGDLRKLLGTFAILKEKYPPGYLPEQKKIHLNELLSSAQKELDTGSRDVNTGLINTRAYSILYDEVQFLSNINILQEEWKQYKQQATINKSQIARIKHNAKIKKNQQLKELKAIEKIDKEDIDTIIEEKRKINDDEKKQKEMEEEKFKEAAMKQYKEYNNHKINISNPVEVSPNQDIAMNVTVPDDN